SRSSHGPATSSLSTRNPAKPRKKLRSSSGTRTPIGSLMKMAASIASKPRRSNHEHREPHHPWLPLVLRGERVGLIVTERRSNSTLNHPRLHPPVRLSRHLMQRDVRLTA